MTDLSRKILTYATLTPAELEELVCEKQPLPSHPGFAISRRYYADSSELKSVAHGPDPAKCQELADADMQRVANILTEMLGGKHGH